MYYDQVTAAKGGDRNKWSRGQLTWLSKMGLGGCLRGDDGTERLFIVSEMA